MATVVLQNAITAPAGSMAQYSATIGSLTRIGGVQHTTLGRFQSRTANGAAGGVPVAGFQRFVIFSPVASFFSTYAELQYNPPSPPAAPSGAITEYPATIGSMTKISGVQHTTLGNLPHGEGHPCPDSAGPLHQTSQRHLADIYARLHASRTATGRNDYLGQLLTAQFLPS
jgi:hypothetical protein